MTQKLKQLFRPLDAPSAEDRYESLKTERIRRIKAKPDTAVLFRKKVA